MSSRGIILETNQCLIHSWGLVGLNLFLLGCLLAEGCSEESTRACLWKAEAMTSSSLTAAQSGNCLSLKKRGMEQECRNKSITLASSVLSRPSLSSRSWSRSPSFSPAPSPFALDQGAVSSKWRLNNAGDKQRADFHLIQTQQAVSHVATDEFNQKRVGGHDKQALVAGSSV